jgi:cell division protease FtsH
VTDKNDSNGGGLGLPTPDPSGHNNRFGLLYALLAIACGAYLAWSLGGSVSGQPQVDTLATSEYVTAVKEERVDTATYKTSDGSLSGTYWRDKSDKGDESKAVKYTSTYVGSDSLADLMADHPNVVYKVDMTSSDMWETILVSVVPTVLLIAVIIYFMRQMQGQNGQAMSFGKTKAKTTEETRPKTKFSDVAGIDEAVEELKEVRDFLAEPERFQKMGAKIPRGVLLVGPPGTGKTLLAKAVAGEAGVPFFSISGSDFVEMFVGVGASRVRDLFKQAKAASPSIIFIDEIDAVGRQRGAGLGGGHDEREQTLNQLLVEMDGFEQNDAVILIAATNRPDILDPALLRPGRFDRQVTVDRPDVKGREHILKVHAKGKPIADDVPFDKLAKLTPGFTGADLMNLMNESALLAARRNKTQIDMPEIEEAMERVIAGPERKGRVMSEKERNVIAYHESGHALVGHILENSDPVHKISIISRGQALGYTMQLPTEDHFLESRDRMTDEIAVLLAGRTSEELCCDDITTGASNDLERATKMAREMVTRYGMSEALGTQVFGEAQHQVFLGRDYADHQDYSPETAKRIDDEVERIMREAHKRATDVLSARHDQLDLMAKVLLARETVEGKAVTALLDDRWDEYLAEHPEEAEAEKDAEAGKVEPSAGADDEAATDDVTAPDATDATADDDDDAADAGTAADDAATGGDGTSAAGR